MNTSRNVSEDFVKHYRIVDFLLVFIFTTSTLVKCVKYDGKITYKSCKKEGLGFDIKVTREKYKQPTYIPSAKRIQSGVYEINYRRCTGHHSLNRFMEPPSMIQQKHIEKKNIRFVV